MHTRALWLAASVATAVVVSPSAQQTSPQAPFKSGVDLILIEATVLDKGGKPIANLQAKDFVVKIGGKTRAVAAAEYIPAGRVAVATSTPAAPTPTGPAPSTTTAFESAKTQLGSSERTIVLAVDVDNIRSGAGRNALTDVAEYIATLPPSDRIGIMTLPGGGTTVEPTIDRAAIRTALGRMAGADHRTNTCDATKGEAAAEAVNDDRGWEAFIGRVLPQGCRVNPRDPTHRDLKVFIPGYRAQALTTLRNLTSLANNLSSFPGRRVIILVSEGLYTDQDIVQEMPRFGAAIERARVVVYTIHLGVPLSEAGSKFTRSDTRLLDNRYGFDGLADAAVFGGGAAIRAISRAIPAITRINQELSGIYLLGIERLSSDPAGKSLEVKVEVSRKGADVRARRNVTISGK